MPSEYWPTRRRAAASSRPTSSSSVSTRCAGHAHGPGGDGERLAAAAPGVLRRGVEQDPDAPAGVRQVAVAPAEDQGLAAVGLGEADEHPHRGGLAGAVGAEEARDGARLAAERDVGDDRASAASLGECFGVDHDGTLAAAGVTAAFGERRATRTMAALTARIDTRPTHCSASPMPSPQYGLDGPDLHRDERGRT